MGKVAGATFVLGALTGFGFSLLPQSDVQTTQHLATVARIATDGVPARSTQPATGSVTPDRADRVAQARTTGRSEPGKPGPVVPVADPGSHPIAPSPSRLSSVRPGDEASRRALARSIQTELKRVGCFDGDADGAWSAGTRKAMKAFTERVNATLPVEEPDYILLMLVQGHTGRACGGGCPIGQVLSKGDKCEPRAVVAQGRRTPSSPAASSQTQPKETQAERVAKAPLPGRMGAGALEAKAPLAPRGDGPRDRIEALPTGPVERTAPVSPSAAATSEIETGTMPGQPDASSPQTPAAVTAPQPASRRADRPTKPARGASASTRTAAAPPPAPRAPAPQFRISVFARLQQNAP